MRRRDVVALMGAAAAGCSLAVRAQSKKKQIGLLLPGAHDSGGYPAFKTELQRLGWREGDTIAFDPRWPGGDRARIESDARAVAAAEPDVIFAGGSLFVTAARHASPTTPVVFANVSDPVGQGFVNSLARPGGTITGFLNYEPEIAGKWLDLLKAIAPDVTRVAVLYNPDTAQQAPYFLGALNKAAASLGVTLLPVTVRNDSGIDAAVAAAAEAPGGGILLLPDLFFAPLPGAHGPQAIAAAARHRVSAVYPYAEDAEMGGLIGYGVDGTELERAAAGYVSRILKGERPADLPVQAPTKFRLAINLKTAKELGLTVPQRLIYTADEVIE